MIYGTDSSLKIGGVLVKHNFCHLLVVPARPLVLVSTIIIEFQGECTCASCSFPSAKGVQAVTTYMNRTLPSISLFTGKQLIYNIYHTARSSKSVNLRLFFFCPVPQKLRYIRKFKEEFITVKNELMVATFITHCKRKRKPILSSGTLFYWCCHIYLTLGLWYKKVEP